jgi:hypothetical protein
VPVGRDIHSRGGLTEELVVPLGLGFDAAPSVRLFLEAGMLNAWSNYRENKDCSPGGQSCDAYHVGAYGAIGVTFLLGRRARPAPTPATVQSPLSL